MKDPIKRTGAITDFKNIRVLPSGFQVTILRVGVEVSKHFAGHSERSYRAALRYRARLLRELPDKRLNKIPRRVLQALHLTKPVVGVFRSGTRKFYQVTYRVRGRQHCGIFPWKGDDEIDAYRTAVEFRRLIIPRSASRGRVTRSPRGRNFRF